MLKERQEASGRASIDEKKSGAAEPRKGPDLSFTAFRIVEDQRSLMSGMNRFVNADKFPRCGILSYG
ncbi:hypothetical protein OH492_20670 [Vibrio chagasii]|nr:hypothetical protein [Vibrio chagasii]